MRVAFAGTPEFSVPSLRILIDFPICDLVAVYTQPDRPAGRGKKLLASPVKRLALEYQLPILQPESFKSSQAVNQFVDLNLDLLIVTAYGLMLPQAILDSPTLGCVNIHASLLPKWRGAAPIQRAIEMGDKKSGITLMQMALGLDSGDILDMQKIDLTECETGGSLHDRLSVLGGKVLDDNLVPLKNRELIPVKQDESLASYAHKLSKSESKLDWSQSAQELERKVRAFNPWPGTNCRLKELNLRIIKAGLGQNQKIRKLGEVVAVDKSGITVQTGEGQLVLQILQKPGGKPMAVKDFINGINVTPGMTFT